MRGNTEGKRDLRDNWEGWERKRSISSSLSGGIKEPLCLGIWASASGFLSVFPHPWGQCLSLSPTSYVNAFPSRFPHLFIISGGEGSHGELCLLRICSCDRLHSVCQR